VCRLPTLAMLAERESPSGSSYLRIIWKFVAIVQSRAKQITPYAGSWFRKRQEDGATGVATRRPRGWSDGEEAKRISACAHVKPQSIDQIRNTANAPLPYTTSRSCSGMPTAFSGSRKKDIRLAKRCMNPQASQLPAHG